MCRKNYLHGCCVSSVGIGLILGYCLDSWLVCCGGGIALLILGFGVMQKK